jgi:hypothetical protein
MDTFPNLPNLNINKSEFLIPKSNSINLESAIRLVETQSISSNPIVKSAYIEALTSTQSQQQEVKRVFSTTILNEFTKYLNGTFEYKILTAIGMEKKNEGPTSDYVVSSKVSTLRVRLYTLFDRCYIHKEILDKDLIQNWNLEHKFVLDKNRLLFKIFIEWYLTSETSADLEIQLLREEKLKHFIHD